VRMGANCKKPAFSVANTGSSGTPVQTSRPCGRWVVGVFQGRLVIVCTAKRHRGRFSILCERR
ncbi:hypothetical protein VB152_10210, partial [Xanthomonas fragariae]|nr:hypothetical protein [Xanthomonas fragariae]